jgi:hypothetical protein
MKHLSYAQQLLTFGRCRRVGLPDRGEVLGQRLQRRTLLTGQRPASFLLGLIASSIADASTTYPSGPCSGASGHAIVLPAITGKAG